MSLGNEYSLFMGRWSSLVAQAFLDWLDAPPHLRWLDVGCGTGALSGRILDEADPASLLGIDPLEDFVQHIRRDTTDVRARFEVATAEQIPAAAAAFDAIVSGLVLNFVPDLKAALNEMLRVAKPGALLAAYVWDYAGLMQFLRYFWDAVTEVDPQARAADEGVRFPICQPQALQAVFEKAGLRGVGMTALDVPTGFNSFDDYWAPFANGSPFPAPLYLQSVGPEQRAAIEEILRKALPIRADGSIQLIARAWAVRGHLPA